MEAIIKEIGKMVYKMDRDRYIFQMKVLKKEFLKTIN